MKRYRITYSRGPLTLYFTSDECANEQAARVEFDRWHTESEVIERVEELPEVQEN